MSQARVQSGARIDEPQTIGAEDAQAKRRGGLDERVVEGVAHRRVGAELAAAQDERRAGAAMAEFGDIAHRLLGRSAQNGQVRRKGQGVHIARRGETAQLVIFPGQRHDGPQECAAHDVAHDHVAGIRRLRGGPDNRYGGRLEQLVQVFQIHKGLTIRGMTPPRVSPQGIKSPAKDGKIISPSIFDRSPKIVSHSRVFLLGRNHKEHRPPVRAPLPSPDGPEQAERRLSPGHSQQ